MFQRSRGVLLAGVMLAGYVLSGNVVAEPDISADDRWLLAKYDVNGDQVISIDEIEEKRKKMFSGMDMDSDGGVSFAEYQEVDSFKRQQLLKARFSKLDLNQDGVLTNNEYSSYLGSFERFDQNGDGNITSAEIAGKKAQAKGTKDTKADEAKANQEDPMCLLWICVRKSIR